MYKPRGKPHEAKNVNLAQQRMALADTIRISSISKAPLFRSYPPANTNATTAKNVGHVRIGYSDRTELKQQRQHFEAFREAYQERVGGKRVVYDTSTFYQHDPRLPDSEHNEPESLMKEFLTRYGVRKVNDIKSSVPCPAHAPKPVQQTPALVRNTIRTVKPQYPLQKLEFGADFNPNPIKTTHSSEALKPILKKSNKELTTGETIKELKEMEKGFDEPEGCEKTTTGSRSKVYTPEDREELFKQLQATENQISVATSQLQAIQKILQDNRMLATVQEEEESDDNEKSCQTDVKQQKTQRLKWKVKTTLRGSQNKRTRLVDTLNLLNNRLQNMQDKYFNAPKVKYKTFDEVVKTSKEQKKNRKGVETIYQNLRYDYDSTMDLDLQPTVSSELKQLSHKADINVKRGRSEPKTKTYTIKESIVDVDDKLSRDRSSCTTETTTMTSSRVAVNDSKSSGDASMSGTSNLTNDTITSISSLINSSGKFDTKNLKSSAELLNEICATNVLYDPGKSSSGDGLKYKNIVFDDDYEQDEEDDEQFSGNNSSLEKAIEKSIKASNYLTKEFDSLRCDYGRELDDMLVTKSRNVRFSEPREIAERVEQVCSPTADRIKVMFSKFDSVLKDSLYSTNATTGK